jgi:hypothetical protein
MRRTKTSPSPFIRTTRRPMPTRQPSPTPMELASTSTVTRVHDTPTRHSIPARVSVDVRTPQRARSSRNARPAVSSLVGHRFGTPLESRVPTLQRRCGAYRLSCSLTRTLRSGRRKKPNRMCTKELWTCEPPRARASNTCRNSYPSTSMRSSTPPPRCPRDRRGLAFGGASLLCVLVPASGSFQSTISLIRRPLHVRGAPYSTSTYTAPTESPPPQQRSPLPRPPAASSTLS